MDGLEVIFKWSKILKPLNFYELQKFQDHHTKTLKCVAYHEAYPRRATEETTELDILFAPIVKLERGNSGFEFEADIDELQIRCLAEANPNPNIFWRKAGGESILR